MSRRMPPTFQHTVVLFLTQEKFSLLCGFPFGSLAPNALFLVKSAGVV